MISNHGFFVLPYFFIIFCTAMVNAKKSCGDFSDIVEKETCTEPWKNMRGVLHPAQQAVGYAAVKRKLDSGFGTKDNAKESMNSEEVPIVIGPGGLPFLVDSHHTIRALEESGFDSVDVTFKKICDWSDMNDATFFDSMIQSNLMDPLGRHGADVNQLPVIIDPSEDIPKTILLVVDDPWRSFGALVRKVKNKKECPKDSPLCLRGYFRNCEGNGHLTPFFEFRWAYFFNDAFTRGCNSEESLWDSSQDCLKFYDAYTSLPDVGLTPILKIDVGPWMEAAALLVPLCRGNKAGNYVLPDHLGKPYAGKKLPGYVPGDTQILKDDPDCFSPECPELAIFVSTA